MTFLLQNSSYKNEENRNQGREKVRMVSKFTQLEHLKYQDDDSEFGNVDNYEYDNEYDDDGYEYDDDENDRNYDMEEDVLASENNPSGNFWSNPQKSLDLRKRVPSSSFPRRRQRSTISTKTKSRNKLQSRPSRRTFRSGNPPPPNVIKDFYDALFWYGFDPDETTTAADRTMFGGTKGKFNGLNLLQDIEGRDKRRRDGGGMVRWNKRRSDTWDRFSDKDEDYDSDDDYNDGDDEDDDYEYENVFDDYENQDFDNDDDKMDTRRQTRAALGRKRTSSSPFEGGNKNQYSMRQGRRKIDSSGSNKVRKKVNQWFEDDDVNETSNQSQSTSPLINLLDKVFQVDPNEVQNQAEDYNRRLGLDSKKRNKWSDTFSFSSKRRDGESLYSQKKTRKGYAYRMEKDKKYDDDDDDDLYDIVDVETYENVVNTSNQTNMEVAQGVVNVIDVEAKISASAPKPRFKEDADEKESMQSQRNRKIRQQTWEDRAAANERVPPRGVLSWGPEGAIDIEARTYAAQRAMKEIEVAKELYSKKEDAVNAAEEALIDMKRDLSILKKELSNENDRDRASMIREEIRIVNFDIEDCSRKLRRAKSEALAAIDKLESIELRHWTLLRQYEADQELEKTRQS